MQLSQAMITKFAKRAENNGCIRIKNRKYEFICR